MIDELSLSDQEKLVAIMEAGCDEVSDIDDLINLTFNLDCYDIMPGINDESDLGYYYAHEAGIYSEKDLGPLANYIDYERYGRDIAMDEQGRFTDEGYLRCCRTAKFSLFSSCTLPTISSTNALRKEIKFVV